MEITKKNLEHQYIELNKTKKECAIFFNCKISKITYWLSKFGIKKRKRISNDDISESELYYYYITLNKSQNECARHFQCDRMSIRTKLAYYGIKKQSINIQKNREETWLKKYGVGHPCQSKDVKEKIKKSNMEKYGVEYTFQSSSVKSKIKTTMNHKYGVDYPSQSLKILDKRKKTRNKQRTPYLNQKNINNFEIWGDDDILIKWIKDEFKKKGRKLTSQELSVFFNTHINNINKRLSKIEKKFNRHHYINHNPKSLKEELVATWLIDNKIEFKKNDRSIIAPLELDFVIKDKKIAIEVNDTLTHSVEYKMKNGYSLSEAKNYHNFKSEMCLKSGYRLIHIFEKDFNDLDNILNILLPTKKVNARDLIYIHDFPVRDFIIENHQQHTCKKKFGGALVDKNNQIFGAITFIKEKNKLHLDKLCIKKGFNIRGGPSKLFKNYIKREDLSPYNSIITFCDTTYHSGKVYEKLGFELVNKTRGMYYWVKGDEWNFRRDMQKYKLQKRFNLSSKYLESHTEREICNDLGYVSIYTSNQIKYSYSIT